MSIDMAKNDFAVIQTGGKQYKVSAGQKVKVEKLDVNVGDVVHFETVLLRSEGGKVDIGMPYLKTKAEAKVVKNGRGEKKIIFKYHSKTRRRRKKGHRQDFTELEFTKI